MSDEDEPLYVTCSVNSDYAEPTSMASDEDGPLYVTCSVDSDCAEPASAASDEDAPPYTRTGCCKMMPPENSTAPSVTSQDTCLEQLVADSNNPDLEVFESTVYENAIPVTGLRRNSSSFTIKISTFQFRRWLSVCTFVSYLLYKKLQCKLSTRNKTKQKFPVRTDAQLESAGHNLSGAIFLNSVNIKTCLQAHAVPSY